MIVKKKQQKEIAKRKSKKKQQKEIAKRNSKKAKHYFFDSARLFKLATASSTFL